MSKTKTDSTVNWMMFTLFLVFMTLKLTGVIAWSWWWVTAPLWMPLVIVLIIMLIAVPLVWFIKK